MIRRQEQAMLRMTLQKCRRSATCAQGGTTRTERASVASQLADAEGFVLELEFRRDRTKTQLMIDTGRQDDPCSSEGYLEKNLNDWKAKPLRPI